MVTGSASTTNEGLLWASSGSSARGRCCDRPLDRTGSVAVRPPGPRAVPVLRRARRPRTGSSTPSVYYCAVGCAQKVFVKDGAVTQIEGSPDSPISRGRLCPKGQREQAAGDGRRPRSRRCGTARRTAPVGGSRPRYRDGHDRGPGHRHPSEVLGVGVRWTTHPAHFRHRQPRRSDPRQPGELPHEKAVYGDGRGADRVPGTDLTLLHGSRSGNLVRPWWRNNQPAGPQQR
jgi:hypothetical protein